MPGQHAQVLDQAPGEKHALKRVFCEDVTGTLYNGMAVCYNRDYGTAADVVWGRATRVEKPTTTNSPYFAGLITGLPSSGHNLATAATGKRLTIVEGRVAQVCIAYCAIGTYSFGYAVYLQNGSYMLSRTATPFRVGIAVQAVTLAAAGEVQILLDGV